MLQGVYANLTIQLYRELDIHCLRVWGAIYSAVTLALWAVVSFRTVVMLRDGSIFESPCIEEIDMARSVSKHVTEGAGGGEAPVSKCCSCTGSNKASSDVSLTL